MRQSLSFHSGVFFHLLLSLRLKALKRYSTFSKHYPFFQGLFVLNIILFASTIALAQDQLLGLTTTGGPQFAGTAFSIKSNGTGFAVRQAFAASGNTPNGDLTKGPDGNFYGMTYYGGQKNSGTIFKMTPKGSITIIRHLDAYNGGDKGNGNLVLGNDGNFYGITYSGGENSGGTIFKVSPTGAFTVLKHLKVSTDGGYSYGSLVKGTDGNFYGLTRDGGTYNAGTIFKITPTGTFKILRHLKLETDGGQAYGNLVQGADGNFYGMATDGGTNGYGTIFKISSSGTFTKLRNLNYHTDGAYPYGSLIKGTDGNFYGMTYNGGKNDYGTIFRLTSSGSFTVRYNFNYETGTNPMGSLVQGTDGNFYGMTHVGGTYNSGVIFKLTPSNNYTVLRHLNRDTEGHSPLGSLVQGLDGSFYGMTSRGGPGQYGTVFKISSTGAFSTLATFPEASKGTSPYGSLVQGRDGIYYGTTTEGGTYDYGTVFKMCEGTFSVIRSFNGTTNGGTPKGNLTQGTDGNFYGMTQYGGNNGKGTIYKITPGGTLTTLRHLKETDGIYPEGGLIQGKDGNFYGMAPFGGNNGYGTIFRLSSSGSLTVLRHLDSDNDGAYPKGSLTQGTDGNFYGLAENGGTENTGTVFRITPAGVFTTLKHFNFDNGAYPQGTLIQAANGNFYGMTRYGGTSNDGTIIKLTTGGTLTVVKSFDYETNGAYPEGSLVQATDGSFYGTTFEGGTNEDGTIFKLSSSGSLTVLRHLKEETDGANPAGSLLIQKANPVANAQSVTTNEDTPKVITLTGSGGTPLTYSVVTQPKNGTISGSGANRTYTPKANFTGTDSFTFTVSWGCLTSAPKTVSITVKPINDDAPVLAAIGNKTVTLGSVLSFTAKATDPDAGQTRTFSLVGAPIGATINATSGAFSWKPTVTGNYTFTVKVTDNGSPARSDQEQITIIVSNTTASTVRLNTGGNAATTSLGSFAADAYFTGTTSISTTTSAIDGTTSDVLYQDNRRATNAGGSFAYSIPVAKGTYTVKLHFAETFHTAAGQRKFNVTAEGAAWLTNYDIIVAAGGAKKAVVASKNITVSDGTLSLNFASVVDKACVSAIEVVSAGSLAPAEESNIIANLYPNPAIDKITVNLSVPSENISTVITDGTGVEVLTNKHQVLATDRLELPVSQLKSGLYLLQIQTNQGMQTYRFMKK